jgi:anti-sigma B factor antagonist
MSHALAGENLFSARIESHGETVVVEASGDLDLSVVKTFENELRKALSDGISEVVLDLAQVTFIDSAGLRALLVIDAESRRDGIRLRVRRELSPAVKRLFELTRTGTADRLPFVD